jgi:diguanylate cyclase (GGDEF)-like protein
MSATLPTALLMHLLPQVLALLAGTPCVVALFDERDVLRWANPAFRTLFGLPEDAQPSWMDMMRANHRQSQATAVQTDDFEHWLASAASRRGKQPFRKIEADLVDGRWMLMTETVGADGWMLCFGTDITDLGQDQRQLRAAHDLAVRASQSDALTGIGNRAFVLARLRGLLAGDLAARPLCVGLADLDHFKRINDQRGHLAGDQVLCDFARLLQGHLRRSDVCGRIGGEEFLVALPDTSLVLGRDRLERLLEAVRASRPLADAPGFGYSSSCGLVQVCPGESVETVLGRADAAMYEAKRTGRDRVCVPD